MAVPQISHCLICEESRQELHHKSTLIGFYGIAPNVEILVPATPARLERLTFVLLGDAGPVEGQVAFQIADADNTVLVAAPQQTITLPDNGRRISLSIQVGNLELPHPGTYRFLFLADGYTHFETTFTLGVGAPSDSGVPV